MEESQFDINTRLTTAVAQMQATINVLTARVEALETPTP
jgi:hypothetical protein